LLIVASHRLAGRHVHEQIIAAILRADVQPVSVRVAADDDGGMTFVQDAVAG
jgi:hypothetical protein